MIPLFSTSLLLAVGVLALLRLQQPAIKIVGSTVTLALCLVPFGGLSIAHYVGLLTGDLSPVTVTLLLVYVYGQFFGRTYSADISSIQLLISGTAIMLYPTALGLSMFDPYSHGYHPIVLSPLLLALFCLGVYRGWYLLATVLAIAFASYVLSILDSDNLWDYLIDPVLAIWCLSNIKRALKTLNAKHIDEVVQQGLLFVAGAFLLMAIILPIVNREVFFYQFIIEDSFVEWATVIFLLSAMIVSICRIIRLRNVRPRLFMAVTAFLALVCFFGAGEEISWGQRIFDIQTPEYFQTYNQQGETGLHNLAFEVGGRHLSVNKLVFGTGLVLGLLIYLFVMTPLYRRKTGVAHWLDRLAVPMPRNYHIAGYLIVAAVVEGLIDSSKRGEMTEFAGSIIFLLNIAFPYNPHIYDAERSLENNPIKGPAP
jgi:hypothetical protein